MSLRQALGVVPFGVAQAALASPAELQNFSLDDQKMNNWCWAAVAISVARHHPQGVNTLDQCVEVKKQFPGCGACQSFTCDQVGDIELALKSLSVTAPRVAGAPDFVDVHTAIQANRPVICRVRKDPGDPQSISHDVVVRYADLAGEIVEIDDPSNARKYWEDYSFWDGFSDNIIDHYIVQ